MAAGLSGGTLGKSNICLSWLKDSRGPNSFKGDYLESIENRDTKKERFLYCKRLLQPGGGKCRRNGVVLAPPADATGELNRFAVLCDAARRCDAGFGRQLRYHRFRQAAAPAPRLNRAAILYQTRYKSAADSFVQLSALQQLTGNKTFPVRVRARQVRNLPHRCDPDARLFRGHNTRIRVECARARSIRHPPRPRWNAVAGLPRE